MTAIDNVPRRVRTTEPLAYLHEGEFYIAPEGTVCEYAGYHSHSSTHNLLIEGSGALIENVIPIQWEVIE